MKTGRRTPVNAARWPSRPHRAVFSLDGQAKVTIHPRGRLNITSLADYTRQASGDLAQFSCRKSFVLPTMRQPTTLRPYLELDTHPGGKASRGRQSRTVRVPGKLPRRAPRRLRTTAKKDGSGRRLHCSFAIRARQTLHRIALSEMGRPARLIMPLMLPRSVRSLNMDDECGLLACSTASTMVVSWDWRRS